ncbi:MAG TPA: hypothetical protein VKX16_04230 [Chloroflexota bacterium]|nr:hypothetical protein [Chloroflexota bacterium]
MKKPAQRVAAIGAAAAITIVGLQSAHASNGGIVGLASAGVPIVTHGHVPTARAQFCGTGFTHMYVNTGGYGTKQQAVIDVYDACGTHVQTFNTTANVNYGDFGSNNLAYIVDSSNTYQCLVMANKTGPTGGAGDWESFLLTNGQITKQVSTVKDPDGGSNGTGPGDVAANPTYDRGVVFSADTSGTIWMLKVGKGCKLGKKPVAAKSIPTGAKYYNLVVDATQPGVVHAADIGKNTIDTYSIKPFRFYKSDSALVSGGADGISEDWTGHGFLGLGAVENFSQVDNGTAAGLNGTSWFTPSGEPGGYDTSDTAVDGGVTHCVFAADETSTGNVGWYPFPGGGVSFGGTDAPPGGTAFVGPMISDGFNLYVTDWLTGVVYASPVNSPDCSINLQPWATETYNNTVVQGIVLH